MLVPLLISTLERGFIDDFLWSLVQHDCRTFLAIRLLLRISRHYWYRCASPALYVTTTSAYQRCDSHTVKIWDTVGEDQTVKWEYKVLSGKV